MWIEEVLPTRIVAGGPLLIALIVRPFYRRLRVKIMLSNYSYMFWYIVKVTCTIMTVDIILKLDGLVDWPWVTVLWPLFILLSILFISSLTSMFVFMSWLCSWLMGNHYSSTSAQRRQRLRRERQEQEEMNGGVYDPQLRPLPSPDASSSCKHFNNV